MNPHLCGYRGLWRPEKGENAAEHLRDQYRELMEAGDSGQLAPLYAAATLSQAPVLVVDGGGPAGTQLSSSLAYSIERRPQEPLRPPREGKGRSGPRPNLAASSPAIPIEAKTAAAAPQKEPQGGPRSALLLERQRQKLGEQLLATKGFSRVQLLTGLAYGRPQLWKSWAHDRLFALSCALQIDLPEHVLLELRAAWGWWHYPRQTRLLLRILAAYAGPRKAGLTLLRCSRLLPWAFAWIYEWKLRSLRVARP